MMNAQLLGAPRAGRFLKSVAAQIVIGHDRHVQRRVKARVFHLVLQESFPARLWISNTGELVAKIRSRANLRFRVQVLHVLVMARRNQDVFVTVQIHIQKKRLPGQIRCRHTGEICNFGKGPIAPIMEQCVAHDLRTIIYLSHIRRAGRLGKHLALAQPQVAAEHIHHHQVQVSRAGKVREIHSHRTGARLSKRQFRHRPKMPVPVVDPNSVRCPIIVANIEVWKAIAVEIPETCC